MNKDMQEHIKQVYKIDYTNKEASNISGNFDNGQWTNKQINKKEIDEINLIWKNKCKNYPRLPDIIKDDVKRIIVIGDIHGDFDIAIRALKLAKVIDNNLRWIGGATHVVQIGDQLDRCRPTERKKCGIDYGDKNDESDIKTLDFFTNLHKEAVKVKGAVYSLLGNHEIMNCQKNVSYVSYEGIQHFKNYKCPITNKIFKKGKNGRKYAFKPGNEYANYMACTRQSVLIIGNNLFVHAGLFPKLAKNCSPHKLNLLVRKWMLNMISNDDYIENIGVMKNILNSYELSPFWPRTLGNLKPGLKLNDNLCQDPLAETLKLWKVGKIFVGHTPQFHANAAGLNSTCSNSVWRVDTGSSNAFKLWDNKLNVAKNRKVQILEILNGNEFNIKIE